MDELLATEILEYIIFHLEKENIRYKQTSKNLIILCPICLEEGKEKIKLHIDNETLIFHCFRCGVKGNIFHLNNILKKYYNISLDHYIVKLFNPFKQNSFIKNSIKDMIEYIGDENYLKQFLKTYNEYNLTRILNEHQTPFDKKLALPLLGYLQKRHISPMLLKIYGINYYLGLYNLYEKYKFNLHKYIIFPTFFRTAFTARYSYNKPPNSIPRYLINESNLVDKVLFFGQNNKQFDIFTNKISNIRKFNYEIDCLYIVEGLFDALNLAYLANKTVITMDGYNKTIQTLLFVYLIEQLLNIKINNIVFIFDKDLDTNKKLTPLTQTTLYYFGQKYNMNFLKFSISNMKDIGDIDNENIMIDFVNEVEKIIK